MANKIPIAIKGITTFFWKNWKTSNSENCCKIFFLYVKTKRSIDARWNSPVSKCNISPCIVLSLVHRCDFDWREATCENKEMLKDQEQAGNKAWRRYLNRGECMGPSVKYHCNRGTSRHNTITKVMNLCDLIDTVY